MPSAAYLIAPLLCPVVMGALMWVMMRPKKAAAPTPKNEIAAEPVDGSHR